eukprot:m.132924 g.132924  ORF g.132924 m.132924 type:complete len:1339 (+) comp11346_c1_seq2:580-4596(+)
MRETSTSNSSTNKNNGTESEAKRRWIQARLRITQKAQKNIQTDKKGKKSWSNSVKREFEQTLSFVPRCVVRDIIAHTKFDPVQGKNTFNARAAGQYRPGAVLMCDASGFTAMTERLAAQPGGAEAMCKIINEYFSELIHILMEYGGEVIKFAGDAILCVFHVGNEEKQAHTLGHAVKQAVRASMDIHANLHEYPACEGVTLSLHMGLGCGDLTTLHVGGVFDRHEFVVAGDPIKQISIAEPAAQAGETVVSAEAARHLQDVVVMEPVETECGTVGSYYRVVASIRRASDMSVVDLNRCVRLAPTHLLKHVTHDTIRAIRKYIPSAVTERIKSGDVHGLRNVHMVAEIREVSVLFIVVNNYDISMEACGGLEQASDRAQRLMLEIQRHVFAQEGSINKMLVDDKGLLTIAVFGLPPLPHYDDPLRAIRAAVAVKAGVCRLGNGVECSVGVTSGSAFCGVIGVERRREYTVMGDMVNLSARLMAAAGTYAPKQGVLVDAATFAITRGQFGFIENLPCLKVKGKAEPVKVYAPLSDLLHAARMENLVLAGCGPELEKTRATVASLCFYHNGGTMVVTGQEGCGRLRIVHELGSVANEARMAFLGEESPDWSFLSRLNATLRLDQHGHASTASSSSSALASSASNPSTQPLQQHHFKLAGGGAGGSGGGDAVGKRELPHNVTPELIKGLVQGGGVYTAFTYTMRELIKHCPPRWAPHNVGGWLLSLLPPDMRSNASDLNGILFMELIPQQFNYRHMTNAARQHNTAQMILKILLNFGAHKSCLILLHLRTGTGCKAAKDREAWALAQKLSHKIETRDPRLPPMVLCVTTNVVPQHRVDEVPLEVADIFAEAKRTGSLQTLSPFHPARRNQHLLDVLAEDYHYDLGIGDIPNGVLQFMQDFASGAPEFINMLVKSMIYTGSIRVLRQDVKKGFANELVVVNGDLADYAGHISEHEGHTPFYDVRIHEHIYTIPREIKGASRSQLDSLTEKEQRLLKVASVMCSFSLWMLWSLVCINDETTKADVDDIIAMVDLLVNEHILERNLTVGAYVLLYDTRATASFKFQCRLNQIESSKRLLQEDRDKLTRSLEAMMHDATMMQHSLSVVEDRQSQDTEGSAPCIPRARLGAIGAVRGPWRPRPTSDALPSMTASPTTPVSSQTRQTRVPMPFLVSVTRDSNMTVVSTNDDDNGNAAHRQPWMNDGTETTQQHHHQHHQHLGLAPTTNTSRMASLAVQPPMFLRVPPQKVSSTFQKHRARSAVSCSSTAISPCPPTPTQLAARRQRSSMDATDMPYTSRQLVSSAVNTIDQPSNTNDDPLADLDQQRNGKTQEDSRRRKSKTTGCSVM